MAFEFSQSISIQDHFDKLSTFAQANGWTEDHAAAGRLFLSKDGVFMSFRWDTGTPNVAGIYQALAFSGSGVDPGNHTDDSGQGVISGSNATILTGRRVELNNGTANYWFFEGDVGGRDYIHVVAENGAGVYVHYGFGEMVKSGTWTGGEYSYGWRHNTGGAGSNQAVLGTTSMLLDGVAGSAGSEAAIQAFTSTLHMEGMPNQPGTSKWALVWGLSTGADNDRGGNARQSVIGGFRGSFAAAPFARFGSTATVGLIPMYPINCWYKDPSNARYYPIGYQPDVRGINIKNYVGAQELTIGAETWVVFPSRSKTGVGTSSTTTTHNQGIAYKKVS